MMKSIRAAGKPAIGHNCFFDLVYILTQARREPVYTYSMYVCMVYCKAVSKHVMHTLLPATAHQHMHDCVVLL